MINGHPEHPDSASKERRKHQQIAVLIDADNTSPASADIIFTEIEKIGTTRTRRIYGDFGREELRQWKKPAQRHAIVPYQLFQTTSGKNATDILLVIDAMDLMHAGEHDAIVIVSSDGDYTRLAIRIREQGIVAYGIGREQTPESFRRACNRFLIVENLVEQTQEPPEHDGKIKECSAPGKKAEKLVWTALWDEARQWVGLNIIGQRLRKIESTFDPKRYGYERLWRMLQDTPGVEMRGSGSNREVRLRSTATNGASADPPE